MIAVLESDRKSQNVVDTLGLTQDGLTQKLLESDLKEDNCDDDVNTILQLL